MTFPASNQNGYPPEPEEPESYPVHLEWPDGKFITLPERTSERASLWAARFTEWIRDHDPEPDMVERALQGLLDEERRVTLLKVERALVKEF